MPFAGGFQLEGRGRLRRVSLCKRLQIPGLIARSIGVRDILGNDALPRCRVGRHPLRHAQNIQIYVHFGLLPRCIESKP